MVVGFSVEKGVATSLAIKTPLNLKRSDLLQIAGAAEAPSGALDGAFRQEGQDILLEPSARTPVSGCFLTLSFSTDNRSYRFQCFWCVKMLLQKLPSLGFLSLSCSAESEAAPVWPNHGTSGPKAGHRLEE